MRRSHRLVYFTAVLFLFGSAVPTLTGYKVRPVIPSKSSHQKYELVIIIIDLECQIGSSSAQILDEKTPSVQGHIRCGREF